MLRKLLLGAILACAAASARANTDSIIGIDSVTHAKCTIGSSVTCGVPFIGTINASLAVAGATTTPTNFTIAVGNTFQSILASNGLRKGCLVQNTSMTGDILYVYFGPNASATKAASLQLTPGSSLSCAIGALGVATDNISVTAAANTDTGSVQAQ